MDRVETFSIDHSGRGIAKEDGKVVFIPKVLDNEVVDINIVENKKNYSIGELVKIVKENPNRIDSICPYFEKCGGCDFLNLEYSEQLKYKKEKILNIFKKYLDTNVIVNDVVSDSNNLYYRNKATFKVNKKIGYYKEKTHDIIDIDKCYIVDKKINEVLNIFRNEKDISFIDEIVVRSSYNTNDSMVIISLNKNKDISFMVEKLKHIVSSIYTKYNNTYSKVYGSDYIVEKMDGFSFVISPDSFFQVNTVMATKLYNKILSYASLTGCEKVLDLYCGTGTIGMFLSKSAKYVLGSEINETAIKDANINKGLNKVNNIDFIVADGFKKLIKNDFDIVIVDPPRSGLDKKTIDNIISLKPKKIIYTSCDPMSLVRDLNILKDNYLIKEVTPFDLFPNTHHVESVTLLELKK